MKTNTQYLELELKNSRLEGKIAELEGNIKYYKGELSRFQDLVNEKSEEILSLKGFNEYCIKFNDGKTYFRYAAKYSFDVDNSFLILKEAEDKVIGTYTNVMLIEIIK
jgi:hypothetical protein